MDSIKDDNKLVAVVLTIISALSFIAVVRAIVLRTDWFNRVPDLMETVFFSVLIIPILALLMLTISYIVWLRTNPEKAVNPVIVLFLVIPLVAMAGNLAFNPRFGRMPDHIMADSLRPTTDGLLMYRFELVNHFNRNARARVFIREVYTGDEFHIYLDTLSGRIGGLGWLANEYFAWAVLEEQEEAGQYILRIPAGVPFSGALRINHTNFQFASIRVTGNATFLIDIPTRTAVRLY